MSARRRRSPHPLVAGALLAACVATPGWADDRPSLFRGIVVADGVQGVRVVSVDAQSQAAQAGLRADDVLIKIDEHPVRTIDEFAMRSQAMRGRAQSATLLVFRAGAPRNIPVHLFSYPVLQEWSVAFVPAHDIRFAEPHVGRDYWWSLGEGFERAEKPIDALRCYLNALHNMPTHTDAALRASLLLTRVSRERLAAGQLAEGVRMLQQSVTMTQHLFDFQLSDAQLAAIRAQLEDTLAALRQAKQALEK